MTFPATSAASRLHHLRDGGGPESHVRIEGNIGYITLSQWYVATIDAEDVHLIDKWKWSANVHKRKDGSVGKVYAVRLDRANQNENQVRMHRVILCAADGIDVDHIDGDGLNNRRSNLRLATKMQNGRNRFIGANNTSGIKGVYQQKKSGRWIARIKVCGASIYLGSFPDAGQAAAAYAKASAEFHGEFGRTS